MSPLSLFLLLLSDDELFSADAYSLSSFPLSLFASLSLSCRGGTYMYRLLRPGSWSPNMSAELRATPYRDVSQSGGENLCFVRCFRQVRWALRLLQSGFFNQVLRHVSVYSLKSVIVAYNHIVSISVGFVSCCPLFQLNAARIVSPIWPSRRYLCACGPSDVRS